MKRVESGLREMDPTEADLTTAEREASEREEELAQDAAKVDQLTVALKVRLDQLKARANGLGGESQTPSFQAELATVSTGDKNRPVALATAIEARNAALRARRAAQEALEWHTETRSKSLSQASAQIDQLEALLDEAERRATEAAQRKTVLASPVMRPPPANDLERAFTSLRSTAPEPIPLTQKTPTLPTAIAPTAPAFAPTPLGRVPLASRTAASTSAPRPRPDERRVHRRVRLETDVSLESESNFFAGFAEDVSAGGLFVATHSYAPLGTEIDVSFRLGDTRIVASGIVRWIRELDDRNPEMTPGMGIQFTSLPEGVQTTIERFVRSREPIFYED